MNTTWQSAFFQPLKVYPDVWEGGNYGLQWTSVRYQRGNNDPHLHRVVQAIKCCPCCCCKGFIAYFTLVTCFFSAANNYILLTDFAPCGAGHIRAKWFSRVHVACSHWYGYHKSATGPSFFQPPRFIGVLPLESLYTKKAVLQPITATS